VGGAVVCGGSVSGLADALVYFDDPYAALLLKVIGAGRGG
jgi:hypothetical protein